MRCPNCGAKIKKGNDRCLKCGTMVEDIKKASHQMAIKARKEYEPNKVVLSTIFPSDLSYKKTLILCLLFGWMGLHCYYVKRNFKAILLTCFTVVFLIFIIPFGIFMQTGEVGFLTNLMTKMLFTKFYVIPCVLGAICVLVWASDFVALCFKNFAVPVVMPEKPEKQEPKQEPKLFTKNKKKH